MKTVTAPLIAMFSTNQDFEQFDLYTFTLTSGLVVRYATCPFDVKFGGNTWLCSRSVGGIVIDEGSDTSGPRAHWTIGLNVGTWEVSIMPRVGDLIGSVPWSSAVRAGILDEATVRVDRGYVAAWPSTPTLTLVPVGILNVFFGRVAEIDFGRSAVQINMNDPRELLATNMPRNLYSAACRYALFSPQCTLNPASFASAVHVTGVGSTTQQFNAGLPAHPDNYFALGNAVFTSGQNAGLRMMIRSSVNASGLLSLLAPMPFPLVIGDALTIYPGCNKTTANCTAFGNLINYGGAPLIPTPETAA